MNTLITLFCLVILSIIYCVQLKNPAIIYKRPGLTKLFGMVPCFIVTFSHSFKFSFILFMISLVFNLVAIFRGDKK